MFAAAVLGLAACASSGAVAESQRLQARAAYERGLSFVRDRQPSPALSALREAIRLDPTSSVYRNALGLVLLELSRPDLALEEFKAATTLEPGYADAHLNYGIALAERRQWEEAAAAYRRALALPTLTAPPAAHQNLGLALYHLRRFREAEQALRFAIALEPEMEAAYYNLGLVFAAEGRKDDARAAFKRTRELAPKSPFGQAAGEQLKGLGEGG